MAHAPLKIKWEQNFHFFCAYRIHMTGLGQNFSGTFFFAYTHNISFILRQSGQSSEGTSLFSLQFNNNDNAVLIWMPKVYRKSIIERFHWFPGDLCCRLGTAYNLLKFPSLSVVCADVGRVIFSQRRKSKRARWAAKHRDRCGGVSNYLLSWRSPPISIFVDPQLKYNTSTTVSKVAHFYSD